MSLISLSLTNLFLWTDCHFLNKRNKLKYPNYSALAVAFLAGAFLAVVAFFAGDFFASLFGAASFTTSSFLATFFAGAALAFGAFTSSAGTTSTTVLRYVLPLNFLKFFFLKETTQSVSAKILKSAAS
jgi:hypothetical protein